MKRFLIRRTIPTLAVLLALPVAAFGYLASSGSGSSDGTASLSRTVTISAGAVTQRLIPTGAPSADLEVALANATNGPLRVTGLVLDTARGTNGYSANAAGCAVSFSPQDNGGDGWTVAAKSTSTITLTNAVTMGASAPGSCQGQTFTIHLQAA